MRFHFFQRDGSGAPLTGATHSATSRYYDGTTGPAITVVESGGGFYYFDTSPTGTLMVATDAGSGVLSAVFRYLGHIVEAAAPTAAEVADAVWDEALSGHTTTGSAGKAAADAALAPGASSIADAVWDEAGSGHVAAGSFGLLAQLIGSMAGLNRRVVSTTYSDGRPVTQTVALYASPDDATADTSRLATITITRAYDSLKRPTTSLQVETA